MTGFAGQKCRLADWRQRVLDGKAGQTRLMPPTKKRATKQIIKN